MKSLKTQFDTVYNPPTRWLHSGGGIFFRPFQIRWKEALGLSRCPYVYRWSLVLFGYSIRLHHWIKSDDRRFYHDHSCNLITIQLTKPYWNITPEGRFLAKPFSPRFMKATILHRLEIPKGGVWSLTLFGMPYKKWGFYVNGHLWRPLRYFHKFGIIQDENYQ